ncbi:hypothetical protein VaNZ11_008428 [Volvox africanus]|uniref:Carbohydrate kinase PfkB domain-containing protein n=1 Tax=Volvox africanus TaxID=51714 RepID=A0ABQ5S6N6_9CHLO|nr:hypothetical protein VaNZ11_008428 [Volvox africanus]
MADGRLAVLLAHLATEHEGTQSQPGSRVESPWFAASNGPLVIIGGVCLDIQPSSIDVQRGTSVPGQIRQVSGGVGRNIAEALSALLPPEHPSPVFVSLVGDDTAGSFLTASLRRLRLDLTHLITLSGAPTPCISAVLDRSGEVAACIADVAAVEHHLTPERLRECQPKIHQACMLLAEGNLSAEALEYVTRIAAHARVPVFLEPVSVPKATRLVPALPYATFVSPNAAELMSIADEVRRVAGLPLLPRPALPSDAGDGPRTGGGGSGGEREAAGLVVELLRQLAAFAEVVLAKGTSCVVLTLGSLGAALITLTNASIAVAPRAPLEPLDACSRIEPGLAAGCDTGSGSCWSKSDLGDFATAAGQDITVRRLTAGAVSVTRSHPQGAIHAAHCAAAAWALPGCGRMSIEPASREDASCRGPLTRQEAPAAPLALVPSSSWWTAAAGFDVAGDVAAVKQPLQRCMVQVVHLRALPAEVVSVNGAGDTLVAGMVAALLQQEDPVHALAYGMAAAKRAVESYRNVPEIECGSLRQDANAVVATQQRYFFPSTLAGTPATLSHS